MNTKKRKLNKPLLLKAVAWLKAHPSQCNMSNWFSTRSGTGGRPGDCGTAGCFAAAICCVALQEKPSVVAAKEDRNEFNAEREARMLAGLSKSDADSLFFVFRWPEKYRLMYYYAENGNRASALAKAVEANVRYFLSTAK